jgi:signal transduction histidine kinase
MSRTSTAKAASRWRVPREVGRLLPVLLPVISAGTAVTVAAVWSLASSRPGWHELAGLGALLVAATVAEAFPVPIEGVAAGRTSLATVFVAAAATLYAWDGATIVAVVAMAVVEIQHRKPPSRVAYNVALYALAAAAAGGAATAFDSSKIAGLTGNALLASAAFYIVDIALLAAVVARSSAGRWARFVRRYLFWTFLPFGIMASLTVILVVLWHSSPFVAIVLAGPLVVIALYERRMHGALSRLRELDRLKDEFIAVVSHELRTPLASVYGAAMTLQQRRDLDPARRRSLLGVIYRESARLARLVDQVLWASRLESGSARATIESVDALGVVEEVVAAARAHLPPGISLELESAAELPLVAADPEKVKQVLVNLVENAVKYSPDGGRIEVRLERVDGYLRFTVEDEGLGIPASEHRKIFEKFHRLDPNLTRGVGGTGLGLYICSELVREMNGRIWVTSGDVKGSAFSFELPRA